ncbi:MAG: prolyl oligopeptidase family serine peptidase [Hymenobacter sp.]
MTPGFSTSNIILLENGGIYAVPNLRGGGEYGESWHNAGTKLKKQNVFDDYIAAAEYLVKNNYTSKDYLAIAGGSNGGLLVGATMSAAAGAVQGGFPGGGRHGYAALQPIHGRRGLGLRLRHGPGFAARCSSICTNTRPTTP